MMFREVSASAHIWWLVPERDAVVLEIFGGELERRGKVRFSGSDTSQSRTNPMGSSWHTKQTCGYKPF